jgi:hypothetical protein
MITMIRVDEDNTGIDHDSDDDYDEDGNSVSIND